MKKIILIIVLIMIALPFFKRAKDYVSEKMHSATTFTKKVEKAVKKAVK